MTGARAKHVVALIAHVAALAGCTGEGGRGGTTPLQDSPNVAWPHGAAPDDVGYATGGFTARRVSLENRHYDGIMYGGWGPHLRPILRDSSGALWHVVDAGPDVYNNDSLLYYRFNGLSWALAGTQAQIGGVQQNAQSILVDDVIHVFGNSIVAPRHVEDCTFDTIGRVAGTCGRIEIASTPLVLPPSANYIGAAVGPDGTRIVWWTEVGSGGTGMWSYVHDAGAGWTAPVVSDIGDYDDFSYVFVAFVDATHLLLGGEVVGGLDPDASNLHAAIARLTLGAPLGPLTVLRADVSESLEAVEDVWLEPVSQTFHIAAHDYQADRVAWFAIPANWTDGVEPLAAGIFVDAFRARFVETVAGSLHLVVGAEDGEISPSVRVFDSTVTDAQLAIDWASAPQRTLTMPATNGWEWPSAIYVESPTKQTTALGGANFAFTGVSPGNDNEIWHVDF